MLHSKTRPQQLSQVKLSKVPVQTKLTVKTNHVELDGSHLKLDEEKVVTISNLWRPIKSHNTKLNEGW